MVDRAAGAPRPASTAPVGGLGPRGRGLFDRLLGGLRGTPAARTEAISLAVASGKGGTGKSFVATSLAVLLHRRGQRTAIVDCDFGLACDHLLLGVKPQLTLQQLVSGKATLDQVLCATSCGPRLLPGASGVRKMAALADKELGVFAREVGALAVREDALVLDLGAGISPPTVLTMLAADQIVLVTQPEIAALVDAYAIVKCIVQLRPNARFLVIMNRVLAPGRGEQAFEKLTEVARQHVGVGLGYLGEIADDARVSQHRLGQLPLVVTEPELPVCQQLAAIAERLAAVCAPFGPRTVAGEQGFEGRCKQHRLLL
ncbi:MAG: P-loop NTPase [Planctomycetes bacterium]|nr:P-loop NTPase [Planctomycetota bacterium]